MENRKIVDWGLSLMMLIEHLILACFEPDPPQNFPGELINSLSLFKAA